METRASDPSRQDPPRPRWRARWRIDFTRTVPVLLILGVCCAALALVLWSCAPETPVHYPPPKAAEKSPPVRVLLTATPLESVTLATTGGYRLEGDGTALGRSGGPLPESRVVRSRGVWRISELTSRADELVLETRGHSYVRFGETLYRGSVRLAPRGKDRFVVINHVDMENYLAGVLAKELYPRWAPETYRAQAVAARTFAFFHMKAAGPGRDYDLGSSTSWQVYGGFTAETDRSSAAARETRGQVLAYGPEGDERVFLAQYSACNGGYVNGADVIRKARDIRALAGGQEDKDGRSCPKFRWDPVRIDKEDVYKALCLSYSGAKDLGGVKKILVVSETPYGRAIWLDVVGPNPTPPLRIRAEDLRLALLRSRDDIPAARKLYSMNCRIRDRGTLFEFHEGRGFGHGVGLSQWGAEDKARRGWTATQILDFYYPGAKIFRVY